MIGYITSGLQYFDYRFINRAKLEKCAYEKECIWYYSYNKVVDAKPSRDRNLPGDLLESVGKYEPDDSFVCHMTNVDLVGPYAIGISSAGKVILETTGTTKRQFGIALLKQVSQGNILDAVDLLSGFSIRDPNNELDLAVSLVGLRSKSYYHWPIEYAPKVRAIKKYQKQTGNKPKILIDENPPEWKLEYLQLLGIDLDQCVEWNSKKTAVDTLIIPIHHANKLEEPRDLAPDNLKWLKSRVLQANNRPSEEPQFAKRIYISRADAKTRQVLNEDEVINALSELGFKRYKISELDVATRARLFDQAEIIVSPHGAGLVNLMFADSPVVIELFQEDLIRPTFFTISLMLGYDYTCLLCERYGSDMHVDVNALKERVADMIQDMESSSPPAE